MMIALGAIISSAAIFSVNSGLGYVLPALIGLESMGIPSPGETALVLAAVLASQGKLNIVIVIVIASASAILGDNIGYLLGRRLGREVLTGRGPMRERRIMMLNVGDRYFTAHGAKTVFIGRWIALIRFATAWLAGINHMRFRTFFFWNALGGITWATAYGVAGYLGGNAVIHVMEKVGIFAAIAVGIAIVALIVVVKLRERKMERELEAEVEADAAENDGGAKAGS
jgi:membrane protein DedA with SNARE-associated domain